MERVVFYGESVYQSLQGEMDTSALLMGFAVSFVIVVAIFAVVSLVLWVWALVDAIKREDEEFKKIGNGQKSLWLILLITSIFFGFSLIISIIYYFVVHREGKKLRPKKAVSAGEK